MATPILKGPVNEEEVKKNLKALGSQVDALMPHLNKAQQAFGGLDEHVDALSDLKDRIAKAKAVYGA